MCHRVIAFFVMSVFCSVSVWPQSLLDSAAGLADSIAGDLTMLETEIQELQENLLNAENSLKKSVESQQSLEQILNGKELLLASLDEQLQKQKTTLDRLSKLQEEQQQQFQKSRQKYQFWLIVLGVLSAVLTGSTIGLAISK